MAKQAASAQEEFSSNSYYSGTDFWIKLKHSTKAAGYDLVEKSLWLYYAARNQKTPPWAKAIVYSALAYFILPTDAIPDFIPISGYTDDMVAITTAVTTIANYIDEDVKAKANQRLRHWFGLAKS
ncbi:MAG TPA: DUF1232 domain-containing protein [Porticoccus sp.]|nr:DUF1232 domain-containing protein [Porticoccus sp.]